MKNTFVTAFGLALVLSPLPASAAQTGQAETQSANDTASPYSRLALALASEEALELSFRSLIDQTMPKMFMADENVAVLEAMCPGTVDTMIKIVEPVMRAPQERGYAQYRLDITELFSANLTIEEASAAAAFYESDLGKKYVRAVLTSGTQDRSIASAMEAKDSLVDGEALNKDLQEAALRGLFELPAEDRLALIKILSAADWFKTYRTLAPQIQLLQLKLANTDLTPKENKLFEQKLGPAIETHLDSCPMAE